MVGKIIKKIRKIDSAVGPKDDIVIQDRQPDRAFKLSFVSDLKNNWVDLTRKINLNTN